MSLIQKHFRFNYRKIESKNIAKYYLLTPILDSVN